MADKAQVAHLLRRTGFGPRPGEVDALAGGTIDAAIDTALARPPIPAPSPPPYITDDSWRTLAKWWLRTMADPAAGIHEKMTWFWHGHLTSALETVGHNAWMWTQHLVLRQHALGNFRAMVQAMTVDASMLIYLNGDPSTAENPNENYSRELMELFTMGRLAADGTPNYTQTDVKNGAKALAGYEVDWDTGQVYFLEQDALVGTVPFLGRDVHRANDVVDAVCDHPSCAPFIAAKIHKYLCGVDPSPARKAELTDVFRNGGLEIRPLVENIVRHPSFLTLRNNRPKFPVEWVTSAMAALGFPADHWDGWAAYGTTESLDQIPFDPPNVAGWNVGTRWISAGASRVHAYLARYPEIGEALGATGGGDPNAVTDAALERCSLYEVTPRTRNAIVQTVAQFPQPWANYARGTLALALAVTAPEFALA